MRSLIHFLLCALALSSTPLMSQSLDEPGCGTTISTVEFSHIQEGLARLTSVRSNSELAIERLAITAHIIRRSDGTGGLSETQLSTAITEVNDFYVNSGLEFFVFDEVRYVDSDLYFDYNSNYEDELADSRDIPNTINIYFANTLISGTIPLCGYTYFPSNGTDRILMANSCTVGGNTLAHEIGHYFTLFHTHGTTNTGTTDELVDGSNCESAGDQLCDTNADPNLSGKVDQDCRYTANERDANGDTYLPDTGNVMSYTRNGCDRLFSFGQYNRIFEGYVAFRTYLHQKEYLADFTQNARVGCELDEIQFTGESIGNFTSVLWEFEGGIPATSTDLNTSVVYSSAGEYDVSLTVYGDDGDSHRKMIIDGVKIIEYRTYQSSVFEDFESIDASYSTFSPDDGLTFSLSEIGNESSNSISMNFFNYANKGNEDYLLIDAIEHPGVMDNLISFDYAFTYYALQGTTERVDEVSLLYKGCDGWETIWSIDGKTGATADPSSTEFVPNGNDWKHVELYLPAPPESAFVQVAIKSINGNGNNLFIDNIRIERSGNLLVRDLTVTDEVCNGDGQGQISIEASFNGSLVTYSLDDVNYSETGLFENLTSGEYTVYIKSEGESIQEVAEIKSLFPTPAKPFIVNSNGTLKLLIAEYEIEWYLDDTLIATNVSSIDQEGSGTYTVLVRNSSGCERISDPLIVLGIGSSLQGVNIVPNPAEDVVNIMFDNLVNDAEVSVFDVTGKKWKSLNLRGTTQLSVSNLPKGVYIFLVTNAEASGTYRILKN